MAIFRGSGSASSTSDQATIDEVTQQATNAASSATSAASSASSAASSASSASNSASTATTQASNASTSATSAASSATSAANSATASANSATAAASSATTASSAETAATTAKTAAEAAQVAAETAETNAETAETNAASSASTASTAATTASSAATTATTKASEASTSATNAATSETNAATSETNAATSASSASTSATTATTKASEASTSATNAATSETNAATSETNAATSASNASTSETNASNSATAAATSATNASTSETNASNSASAASTSATNASNSATAAQTAQTAAETALDSFDDRYLGAKSSAPTVDNDGDPLITGALYYDTTASQLYIWDGSAWDQAAFSVSGAVTSFNTRTGAVTLSSGDVTTALGYTPSQASDITTAINNLVDAAPSTLDTLNELAAALGDDANFSVTITNSLATKAPLASPTFTGTVTIPGATTTGDITFGDNNKAIFGAGSDFTIEHNGSKTKLSETGTGNLEVRGTNIDFLDGTGLEYYLQMVHNGAVTLYNNNSAKLATTSTGVNVTGTVTADGASLDGAVVINESGVDVDFRVESDTNANALFVEGSSGNVGIGTTPSSSYRLTLYDTTNSYLKIANGTTGTTGSDGFDLATIGGDARLIQRENGPMQFLTNGTEAMRIDSSGNLLIGATSDTGTSYHFFDEDGFVRHVRDGATVMILDRTTSDGGIALFRKDGSTVGQINSNSANSIVIGSQDVGLRFFHSGSAIYPMDADSNSDRDAAIDLGTSSTRFKDLYLSSKITNNGTGGINIDTSGNVGIGTSSPSNLLTIQGSGTTRQVIDARTSASNGEVASLQLWSKNSGGTNNYGYIDYDGDGNMEIGSAGGGASAVDLVFDTNGAERMRLDSSGNLLVGKTSSSVSTVGAELTPSGTVRGTVNGGTCAFFNRTTSDGDIVEFRKDGTAVGTIGAKDGDLGIGTGTAGLRFFDQESKIIPYNATTQASPDNAVDLGRYLNRFKDLYLSGKITNDGTGGINIDTSGNVGIGTSSPDGNLQVESTGQTEVYITSSDTDEAVLAMGDTTLSTDGGIRYANNGQYLRFIAANGERVRIESDGDLHADGDVIAYSTTISDIRLKDNIVGINNALAKVGQLNGYTFEYKADGKVSAGVIAQEVEKVLPEAVSEKQLPLKTDDDQEYKVVNYDALHGLLIEAIKEQQAQIEELKSKVEALEAK